jgi:hypothetical protein
MTTSPRTAHLVGSGPGRNATDFMTTAWDILGPRLRTMPDGETGERADWIGYLMTRLTALGAVTVVRPGAGTCYEDTPRYGLALGSTLTPGQVERCTPLERAYTGYAAFERIRAAGGRPGVAYQIGIPSPADIAYLAFGPDGVHNHTDIYGPLLDGIAGQIAGMARPDITFQLETAAAVHDTGYAAEEAQPKTAAEWAARLADLPRLVAAIGVTATYGVHLCFGDVGHKARTIVPDLRPLVLLANELGASMPPGHFDYLHMPMAAGDIPPRQDGLFYEPLADLDLPPGVRFIAGFVHQDLELDEHLRLRGQIEHLTGFPVDVAAPCGLGRYPHPDQAYTVMGKCRDVADAA